MLKSRYRRFAAARTVPLNGSQGEIYELSSERPGYAITELTQQAYELARLHDGQRSAEEIRQLAAAQLRLHYTPQQIEGFAANLAQAGLLFPGTHEPVPVPAYTDSEAAALGWNGGVPGRAGRALDTAPMPPSSVPGSRGNPGLISNLDGVLQAARGSGSSTRWPLPEKFLVSTGRFFNGALIARGPLTSTLLLALIALITAHAHRLEFTQALAALWNDGLLGWQLLPAVLIMHGVSSAARAHAIARYSPERPRCSLALGFLRMPFLQVDAAGVIERVSRSARVRIIAAPLLASLLLAALALFGWLIFAATHPRPAQFMALLAVLAFLSVLLRVNPLSNRDGYMLLTHWLGILDLREQAMVAVFRVDRPWNQQARKLPRWILLSYAMLCVVFVFGMIAITLGLTGGIISDRFGGIGFVLLVSAMGAYMFRQLTKDRISAARSTLGWDKNGLSNWRPTRRQKIIGGVVFFLCIFPYRYEPSGDLVVLPSARADVRALVAGDVREVLLKEGDEVKAGQVIARLRDDEPRAKVAQSQAELAQLQADLAVFKRGAKAEEVEVARQRVSTAKKRAEVSRENAKRLKQAFDRNSITAFEYDRARGTADVDEQSFLEAQRALELTSSPAMSDQIAAKEAQVNAASAALEFNRKQLAETEIKAPIAGRLVSGSLKFAVGTYLNRGDLLATVENSKELLAEIQLPESSVGEIKPGNDAVAKVWAYPGTTFDGVVQSVAPSAEQGEYGKVVRVQMTLQDPDQYLRPEMTGSAKLEGDRHMAIVVFTRALRRFLFIEVWSWLP